jgi:hypothetical protein
MSARDPFFNFESVVRDHLGGELLDSRGASKGKRERTTSLGGSK